MGKSCLEGTIGDDEPSGNLNTTVGLNDQIWMSDRKDDRPNPTELESVEGEMHLPIKPTGGM